jgi:hypothetical protein
MLPFPQSLAGIATAIAELKAEQFAADVMADPAREGIVAECSVAAAEDFNELWAKQRVKAGGTRERDGNLFVLGAAYGLAWAMANLTLDGAGNVTLSGGRFDAEDEDDEDPEPQEGEDQA